MVIGLVLGVRFVSHEIGDACLRVCVVILRLLRLRLVINRWRDLAQSLTGVPYLQYNVEDSAVDLPRSAAENIQTSIDEL